MRIAVVSVPGRPRPKARHRDGINARTGARMKYTPRTTADFEHLVASYARIALRGDPRTGPIGLLIIQSYALLKSWSKRKCDAILNNPAVYIVKPDADNVVKAVKDSLKPIVYCDDAQVSLLTCVKRYARQEETKIFIYDATEALPTMEAMLADMRPYLVRG